jgi:alanine dehydrogenase
MTKTTIGIPREIKDGEYRVGMLPSAAYQLISRGHQVLVERDAGVGSAYSNDEYRKAGAEIVDSATALFERSQLIVKVKEPQPSELDLLTDAHTLFTYLHLAADKA